MPLVRTAPDEWPYETNKKIALAAEEAGLHFLFPVSRWRGFGGKTNYLGTSLETMTWASALLAVTQKIHVYSTVHIPVFHPLVAAKMGASLDHIGNGRWGINIVSGWSKEEFGRLYDLGMDGVLMVFLSYYEDTVRFGKEIMPLLRQMGVVAA